MTHFDPNKFDPSKKHLGANLNPNKQGGGRQEEATGGTSDAAPAGDPHADLKLDPEHLMSLLSAQSKYNLGLGSVKDSSIERSVRAFEESVSPERHARLEAEFKSSFAKEFGKIPNAEVLQQALDNYLIGAPSVEV